MALSKFLDPKNDFAFKKIFGSERNQEILIHFLNDMLGFKEGEKVQTVHFLKPIQDPETLAKKQSIVDVLCEDEQGRKYIVEMQVAKIKGFEKRAQYYAAKAYVNELNEKALYSQLKEIIFLAITDFVMFPEKTDYKSDHVILDKNSYVQDLKDFSFTFLELPKFNKEISELRTMVEKWTYFFKHAEETTEEGLDKIVGEDLVLQKAYSELNKLAWTENELAIYEKNLKSELDLKGMVDEAEEKGLKKGMQKGIQKGIQKGMEQGRKEGVQEGIAQGRKEGVQEGASKLFIAQLLRRFGNIPDDYMQKIQEANGEKLLEWSERLLETVSLQAIFDE